MEDGQVGYDRLTHCEPAGMPRWLLEPYTHEFINLPGQSWFINDFSNGIRRVYINKEHTNLAEMNGSHSWYGDTIGFWDGETPRDAYQVPDARRLHTLVADDKQPVRNGGNLGNERVRRW